MSFTTLADAVNQIFAFDVLKGLMVPKKYISSQHFYDEKGSELFHQITQLEEYYLTRCEKEIFESNCQIWGDLFAKRFMEPFTIVELGCGDGQKTQVLLEYLIKKKLKFTYRPIDISEKAIEQLGVNLKSLLPKLDFKPVKGDFFDILTPDKRWNKGPMVLMFLGATIGNFEKSQALSFLTKIGRVMHPVDLFLIGFDLKKSPRILQHAYDDSKGITKAFNLNLLERMNRELRADFNVKAFEHHAVYQPVTGRMDSYLVSTKHQIVRFKNTGHQVVFQPWEAIHTELSQKYSREELDLLTEKCGFRCIDQYLDKKEYFQNCLWEIKK